MIQLELAEASNFTQLIKLQQFAYRAWSEQQLAPYLSRQQIWLAKTAADVDAIGFYIWHSLFDESELLSIVVAPSMRQRGVAKIMLQQLYAQAKASNQQAILLEVAEDNYSAIKLYCQQGFKAEGRRKNYYHNAPGGACDAILMRKPLTEDY